MKTDFFGTCGHCCVIQICWHIKCSTFSASSFRIWNNSTGIPSPLLALFVVMLPKAYLTSLSRMSGSSPVITLLWLSGSWRSFLYSSPVYSCHLFSISFAFVRSIPYLSFILATCSLARLTVPSVLSQKQRQGHNSKDSESSKYVFPFQIIFLIVFSLHIHKNFRKNLSKSTRQNSTENFIRIFYRIIHCMYLFIFNW